MGLICPLKNKTEFRDILFENTRDYDGKLKEVIKFAPQIYDLLCKLLEDGKFLSPESRQKICAAVAYFILPMDIIPEEITGAYGYIDDMYICLYVLKDLEVEYEFEALADHWNRNIEELKILLVEDYATLEKELGDKRYRILEYAGLK